MTRKRSLSGIKPTGQPHWGNYFGMIRPAIALADAHEAFYFVADLHACRYAPFFAAFAALLDRVAGDRLLGPHARQDWLSSTFS
mgnify:CR=1 FL=1